jgi:hypothetical protein
MERLHLSANVIFNHYFLCLPIPVATRSTASVGIAGSNLAGDMDVSLL